MVVCTITVYSLSTITLIFIRFISEVSQGQVSSRWRRAIVEGDEGMRPRPCDVAVAQPSDSYPGLCCGVTARVPGGGGRAAAPRHPYWPPSVQTLHGVAPPPPADPTFNFMFTTDLVASARFLDTCRDSVIHTTTGQDRPHAGREYTIYMIWKIHFHEKPAKGPDFSRASSSWLAHVRPCFLGRCIKFESN